MQLYATMGQYHNACPRPLQSNINYIRKVANITVISVSSSQQVANGTPAKKHPYIPRILSIIFHPSPFHPCTDRPRHTVPHSLIPLTSLTPSVSLTPCDVQPAAMLSAKAVANKFQRRSSHRAMASGRTSNSLVTPVSPQGVISLLIVALLQRGLFFGGSAIYIIYIYICVCVYTIYILIHMHIM